MIQQESIDLMGFFQQCYMKSSVGFGVGMCLIVMLKVQ